MLDYILIGIVIITVLISSVRGFFNELRLLAAIVVSFFITYFIAPLITASFITDSFSVLALIIYVLMFIVVFIIMQIVANFLLDNFESGDGIDILFGSLFGLAKGFMLVCFISLGTVWFNSSSVVSESIIRNAIVQNTTFISFFKNLFGEEPSVYMGEQLVVPKVDIIEQTQPVVEEQPLNTIDENKVEEKTLDIFEKNIDDIFVN